MVSRETIKHHQELEEEAVARSKLMTWPVLQSQVDLEAVVQEFATKMSWMNHKSWRQESPWKQYEWNNWGIAEEYS